MNRLLEVAKLSLRLGGTAFGGPAAHIAMLHDDVVTRRKWLTEQQFLDLLGATNLIPGPNSTEMVIHVGYLRAGWPGLIIGGLGFILPAMCIVMGVAWGYVQFGRTPQAGWLFYGLKPVIIAIILQALWLLRGKALPDRWTLGTAVVVMLLYFAGGNELLLLAGAGVVVMLARSGAKWGGGWAAWLPVWGGGTAAWGLATAVPFHLPTLFLTFLKIGSVLYGSGYVLLAFLHRDFVQRLGWLTGQQLIDAIAVGQFTPGPVFTTATFIGYLMGGLPAALLATLGIFLPSFIFVALSQPLIPRLRQSVWAGGVLDGVNAASLGLMAAVTWQLGRSAIVDPFTGILGLIAALLLFRYKVNTTWLLLGGAVMGWVAGLGH